MRENQSGVRPIGDKTLLRSNGGSSGLMQCNKPLRKKATDLPLQGPAFGGWKLERI